MESESSRAERLEHQKADSIPMRNGNETLLVGEPLTLILGKLEISRIDFNNICQTLHRVFSHYSAISGIDYEHFLFRPELDDDPTNIRLTR